MPFSRGSSRPRNQTRIVSLSLLHWEAVSFTTNATWEASKYLRIGPFDNSHLLGCEELGSAGRVTETLALAHR